MTELGGTCEPGFGAVADAFRKNFSERNEIGAACCVVQDGKSVVDLWGGHLDRKRTKPWQSDTIVTMWSTTKGMAATCMAIAHSRGLFELDQPVANYWPEFAQAGKGDITVRQLLGHEAGLVVIHDPLDLEILADHERLGTLLAKQPTTWVPGEARGYHAQSLGLFESQILSRIDPDGRTIGKFFADEVASVLDIEFYIGLPKSVDTARIATFIGGSKLGAALRPHLVPWPLLKRLMNPFSETFKAFTNPKAITKLPDINKPKLLNLELPSVNGTGTARAVAKVYGDLATGGTQLGVSRETLDAIEAPVAPRPDRIFGADSAFSFGFMKAFPILPFGTSPRAFGHTGSGGSFGYADPDAGIGYGYAMNRAGYAVPLEPREVALREAMESCLS